VACALHIQCDHRNDQEVKKVFETIAKTHKSLDILVNNVWGDMNILRMVQFWNEKKFWTQPLSR
jgi:dehydrogenase/reductase SDR family protein 1